MAKFVLGVDGGGTKTHCALFDIYGNKIDLVNWEPTNYECMQGGFSELKEELEEMTAYILDRNSLRTDDLTKSVFGLGGVDTVFQHDKNIRHIGRTGNKGPHPLQ